MSEIFEALQKAQRDAFDDHAADGAGNDANGTSLLAPAGPAPLERQHRRRRRGWWSSWLARGHENGRTDNAPLVLDQTRDASVVGEQFRLLRTRLETVGPAAYMVTSALAQEGKTLCATNLALSLALRMGHGVILVDTDLRRPWADTYFDLDEGPGMVDYLLGEADWRDCLRRTRFERLQVLPAGRSSSMAPELLESSRLRQLTDGLKAEYPKHHLVFDSPPVLLTADPMVLARHMDHILLVVRAGVTPRAAVLKAVETLGAVSLLGIVLNDAQTDAAHYYYYGSYSYTSRSTPP